MPRRYVGDIVESFDLRKALDNNETCDVFVAHKKDDDTLAKEVAFCIKVYGLDPWLDDLDPKVQGDGPDLDVYIKDIISGSFSLLAVVSDATEHSWWVPFEIGLAFAEECLLASYLAEPVSYKLPSFLAKHPRLKCHRPDLHDWCEDIKDTKGRFDRAIPPQQRLYREGVIRASNNATYLEEMRRMTRRYR